MTVVVMMASIKRPEQVLALGELGKHVVFQS